MPEGNPKHTGPIAIPFKVPTNVVGFEERKTLAKPALCARLYGFSVRDCACKLAAGGWLECPTEARGLLEPIAEFRKRIDFDEIINPPSPVAEKARAVLDNSGFARASLRAVKIATSGQQAPPRLITDIEPEPNTPEQVRAVVAAERATLPVIRSALLAPNGSPIGGREMGFTGNICQNCQSTRMVRNGVCETCLDCFHSGECG